MYRYKYTRSIIQAFKKMDIGYIFEEEKRDYWIEYVKFCISVNDDKTFEAEYCCIDDDMALFHVYNIINFPDNKIKEALQLCNELNKEIPYIKFIVEQNNSICMTVDVPVELSAEVAELILLFAPNYTRDVLNKEYERIMKAINNDGKNIKDKSDGRKAANTETLIFFINP